ncbi:TPA: 2Fe-2S iron-sulfur cluster binding domain-containing protein [Pseudomonas aeruginosa]|uniref:Xylene monooxygenase electron transfer subunit n=4 Tax=Pseudomonadaceae TaxID=135621 RepID=F1LIV7_PSEPU|nr:MULTISPECIES: 2Fe-2S iron-sulfur cluster-binding protein [Pseudomonas]MDY7555144.1 2Fe-2S iron-sulfur cluster-binding protein [Pseudomonas sp. FG1]MEB0053070.1 2Fe-2S iron-sulfur cluster-binding protein [Pseudomonas sp. FG1]OPA56975.1 ferredoxin--NAD(+) reductase [Pseudomonas aeruginosa]BAF02446.1 xylene monooxygenase electron transfer subunit [Pseudomonas putida]HCL3968482.1 2Fe-2S iron-sulfur cluster binding domain-containing protein [Pseudomonas aeruginosa]
MNEFFKKISGLFVPPRESTVSVRGQGFQFKVPRGQTILESALHQGIAFPHDCKVGSCGTCKYKLISGRVNELTSSAMGLSGDLYQSGYRLGCQCIPKEDLEIELDTVLGQALVPIETSALIRKQKRLAHDIVELELVSDKQIAFYPGQYADVECAECSAVRSYSFATPPQPDGSLSFHVRLVPGGIFSGWLFGGDRTGATLTLRAPYGQFGLHESNATMVCVAGGTGLAPIKCVLQSMTQAQRKRDVLLFFGARQQRDLYCLDEIEALQFDWGGRFELIPVLSEESSTSSWKGKRGMVTEYFKEYLTGQAYEGYLCGPPPMVDAAETELVRLGVARELVFADRFYNRPPC